jgi:hypothetical protein
MLCLAVCAFCRIRFAVSADAPAGMPIFSRSRVFMMRSQADGDMVRLTTIASRGCNWLIRGQNLMLPALRCRGAE